MNPAWVAALVALVTLVLAVLGWVFRVIWRAFKRTDQFLEDWNGAAGDRAHEARPGVMERLVQLEHSMTDIQGQVHLNSGHSMRDEVQRIEAAVEVLDGKVERIATTQSDIQRTVDVLKAR